MNPQDLIPIDELPLPFLEELFDKNERFQYKVREFVEQEETFELNNELYEAFNGVNIECEYGPFTNTVFRFNNAGSSTEANKNILLASKHFVNVMPCAPSSLGEIIDDALQLIEKIEDKETNYTGIEEDDDKNEKEIDILEAKVNEIIDYIENEIKRFLRCVGEMLENDGYIKSFISAYADCHNVYYNDEEKDLFVIRRIQ